MTSPSYVLYALGLHPEVTINLPYSLPIMQVEDLGQVRMLLADNRTLITTEEAAFDIACELDAPVLMLAKDGGGPSLEHFVGSPRRCMLIVGSLASLTTMEITQMAVTLFWLREKHDR